MKHYPKPFGMNQVEKWIERNTESYKKYNHGLWAVILKGDNIFLGDCGITIQEIDGQKLPEIGYHMKKEFCNKGYATEAAKACIEYGLSTLTFEELYTYTNRENKPSIRVAEKVGFEFVKIFEKNVMGTMVEEVLYRILREQKSKD